MGSYDTGEVSYNRRSTPTRTRTSSDSGGSGSARARPSATPRITSDYDPDMKTIVALGGGLTPDRIVKPVPTELVRDGSLQQVIDYMMGDEVATTTNDRAIAEEVRSRMQRSDYRLIVNEVNNLAAGSIGDQVTGYTQQKTQNTEDGEVKFNYVNLAVVSHDEGGRPYRSLDSLL